MAYHSEVHVNVAVASQSKKHSSLSIYSDGDDTVQTYRFTQQEQIRDLVFANPTKIFALSVSPT